MKTRWDTRYSSCEYMYLDLLDDEVRCYLDHSPKHADVFSLHDVLAGKADALVNSTFGGTTLEELKAAVRERLKP